MKIKTISAATAIGFIFSMAAFSDQITVISTSVSDGLDYTRTTLDINGVKVAADCYDDFDPAYIGQSWQASELTLAQAAAAGKFSGVADALAKYSLIGAITILNQSDTDEQQISVEHNLWNIFDPGRYAVTTEMTAQMNAAKSAIPTINFDNVRFLESPKGIEAQTFSIVHTPEPMSLALMGSGFMMLGLFRRRKLAAPARCS